MSAHNPRENAAEGKFKDSINVPIAIPAWGALVLIAGAIYTAGTMVNKMDTLIAGSQRADDAIASIKEKQIIGAATVNSLSERTTRLEAQTAQQDGRISGIERERRK